MNKRYAFSLIFFLTVLVSGCANNMSQNSVNETHRQINGGTYRNVTWSDTMDFKRVSWFQELTMIYDAWFYRLPPESPFRQWFSKDELKEADSCRDLIIVVHYQYDSKRISDRMFKEEMNLNKYEDVFLSQFAKNLKLHPDAIKWRLQKHKVIAFCRKNLSDDPIVINFPNFQETIIRF